MSHIKLIVGLGNPGTQYASTRHNAGFWFTDRLCDLWGATSAYSAKFKANLAVIEKDGHTYQVLQPLGYMNCSGLSVQQIVHFYKMTPSAMLVAHDELDLPVGAVRFKQGGGHGGHNGLRSLIAQLGTGAFWRLRLGIGRPSHANVADYVLRPPSAHDAKQIDTAITQALDVLPLFLKGDTSQAMTQLHTAQPKE